MTKTFPFLQLMRWLLLAVAAAVWLAFLLLPLLSDTVANYHGVAGHGLAGNLIYTLIGLNYVGGLYALDFLNLNLPFLWVFGWLILLAMWY